MHCLISCLSKMSRHKCRLPLSLCWCRRGPHNCLLGLGVQHLPGFSPKHLGCCQAQGCLRLAGLSLYAPCMALCEATMVARRRAALLEQDEVDIWTLFSTFAGCNRSWNQFLPRCLVGVKQLWCKKVISGWAAPSLLLWLHREKARLLGGFSSKVSELLASPTADLGFRRQKESLMFRSPYLLCHPFSTFWRLSIAVYVICILHTSWKD